MLEIPPTRKCTFLIAKKCTSLFAKKGTLQIAKNCTFLFAKKRTLLFTVYKGVVAFHDYDVYLPQTTAKINELVKKHYSNIQETFHHRNKHILFVIKK